MRDSRRFLRLVLAAVALSSLLPSWRASAQEGPEDEAALLLGQMSDAAKVGQLFIVTFPGTDVEEGSAVAELIRDYHIGGVLLRPENGNIANDGDAPTQVASLVSQLQRAAWDAVRTGGAGPGPPYVHLLVAVTH